LKTLKKLKDNITNGKKTLKLGSSANNLLTNDNFKIELPRFSNFSCFAKLSNNEQVNTESGSSRYQISNIRSGSGQEIVSSIRSRSGQIKTSFNFEDEATLECILAPQQQKIYSWFLNNGITGYFNKGQIQRETGIGHPTIRKCINKFINLNLIKVSQYDPASRLQKYKINLEINVSHLNISNQGQVSSIRSRSSQEPVSNIGSGSGQGHIDTKNTSYKIDRKILNNLSIYLKHSNYWRGQGLSLKKCETWISEIEHCDYSFLLTQLQFGEFSKDVINSERPLSYFRTCLLSGGLERPKGFEFPEEKVTRIKNQEIEVLQNTLNEQKAIREKEKKIADKLTFMDLLKDKENIGFLINEIKKSFLTPKMKISIKLYQKTGQIDSKLEKALEREFEKD